MIDIIGFNLYVSTGGLLITNEGIFDEGAKVRLDEGFTAGSNCSIHAPEVVIGKNVSLKDNVRIYASRVVISDNVTIGRNFVCRVSKEFALGRNSILLHDISFTGMSVEIGRDNFIRENVTIGGGGSTNEDSTVSIGDECLICENALINNARSVKIGSHVGIGKEVDIWTHGGFMRALEGYPTVWAPVVIGDNVWIPSRTTVLAGVTIGDDVIIGNHSLVNRDIPKGAFVAGVPVKVIKEDAIPKKMTDPQKAEILSNIVREYTDSIMGYKGISANISQDGLKVKFNEVVFDCESMEIVGELDDPSEDFRDHLRRNGVKFFTDSPFRSIAPTGFARVMK